MKLILLFFACILNALPVEETGSSKTIQINIDKILNARPVTTLADNKLTTWKKGIDGNGLGDGYLTKSAALFNGDKEPHALPDDALFPANESHPAIQLYYANNNSTNNQACSLSGEVDETFTVLNHKYKAIFLALTSAEGATALTITLNYADGADIKKFIVPDYYKDVDSNDQAVCYLAHDLAKWGNKNNMTEKDHHNIDLLKITADSKRVLKSIKISKTKAGYLVFWAATGLSN